MILESIVFFFIHWNYHYLILVWVYTFCWWKKKQWPWPIFQGQMGSNRGQMGSNMSFLLTYGVQALRILCIKSEKGLIFFIFVWREEEGFLVSNERASSPIYFSACWHSHILHVKLWWWLKGMNIKNEIFLRWSQIKGWWNGVWGNNI